MATPYPQHIADTLGESPGFLGVSEDAPEELDGPPARREEVLVASSEDNVVTGRLAYAVHADQLVSTRGRRVSALQSSLDEATVALTQAALSLASSLRVPDALCRLAESVCSITGASWGAIAMFSHVSMGVGPAGPLLPDSSGASSGVGLCSGVSAATLDELAQMAGASDAIGTSHASPESLFSGLEDAETVIDNDLGRASALTGAIEGEETGSLLSAPLHLHGQVYEHLYLCDKPGGFTRLDTDVVLTLAQAAVVAIKNAHLHREARDCEQWMVISQELTTLLFLGAEEDDILTLITHRIHQVVHVDITALILPSIGERWIYEITDGEHARELIDALFPPEDRALTTLAHQTGPVVDSLEDAWGDGDPMVPQLAQFGSALYAPMIHRGRDVGVMLLLHSPGAASFAVQDLEIVKLVAGRTTMVFELTDVQHAEEMATLLNERTRVGRGLHDLAIQRLFATGMQASAVREWLASNTQVDLDAVCSVLSIALEAMDDFAGQARSIVRSLRDRDEEVGVIGRLRCGASLTRSALGCAPSLLLNVDGRGLAQVDRGEEDRPVASVDTAVIPGIVNDVVAIVREGLSNMACHAHASSVAVDIEIEKVQPGSEQCRGPGDDKGHTLGGAEPFRDSLVMEIVCRDDDVGVNPSVTHRSGTANMAERARRHGGSFAIGSQARSDGKRRGTRFT